MNKYTLIGEILENFSDLAKLFTSLEDYITKIEMENLRNGVDALDDAMAKIIENDIKERFNGH